VSRRAWEVEHVLEQLDRWNFAARRSRRDDAEARDWRRRLNRLRAEAAKREAGGEIEWFFWLAEFGSMIGATLNEDFESRYAAILARVAQTRQKRRASTGAAAAARRAIGAAKRELAKAGKAHLSPRQVRRYRTGK